MLWQEPVPAPDGIAQGDNQTVDLVFRLSGRWLPVDHAHALSAALGGVLPWLEDEQDLGVHLIHVAASGNGWVRPEPSGNSLLVLSRRTRLTLRLPLARVEAALGLAGSTLDIGGYPLTVHGGSPKPLNPAGTLLSRYVVAPQEQGEEPFSHDIAQQLRGLDIHVRRMLCGKSHAIATPSGPVHTRSIMVADLRPEESLRLQVKGIGPHRHLGCGLFIPHKSIDPIRRTAEE